MKNSDKLILVTGSTGHQGGAVVKSLLKAGFRVRALTRDPSKPIALSLVRKGAEAVKGDLNDTMSIRKALAGAYGVFSVQTFMEEGTRGEVRQGKLLADEAKKAGIKHFVYSSVGAADRKTGIPHFESKWEIEEHIRSIGIPATVFRPVFFMYNFNSPFFNLHQSILNGFLPMPLKAGVKLQMLAVEDLGEFVRMAFEEPDKYLGKAIELAGDELTMKETAETFSRVLARTVNYIEVPISEVRKVSADMAVMFEWFNREGYHTDIPALRKVHKGLLTLQEWLVKTGWREEWKKASGQ